MEPLVRPEGPVQPRADGLLSSVGHTQKFLSPTSQIHLSRFEHPVRATMSHSSISIFLLFLTQPNAYSADYFQFQQSGSWTNTPTPLFPP